MLKPPDMMAAFLTVPQRERELMMQYYGMDGKVLTLEEVGARQEPPISRERVRQLISRGMENLDADERFALDFLSHWPKSKPWVKTRLGFRASVTIRGVAKRVGMGQHECALYAMALRAQGFQLSILSYGKQDNAHAIRYALRNLKRRKSESPENIARREKFIKLWNDGVDSETIQKEMGYTKRAFVCFRAKLYRDQGHKVHYRLYQGERHMRTWGKGKCWCGVVFTKTTKNKTYCSDQHRIVELNRRSAINAGLPKVAAYYEEWKSTGVRPPHVYPSED